MKKKIKREAKRYRWLRDTQNAEFRCMNVQGAVDSIFVMESEGYSSAPWPNELDDLVDKAMRRWKK